MSKLILTADDFGLNDGVNAATIQSVRNRTVTSVQVMVNLATEKQIRSLAAAIHESGNLCGIGLHFCTTYGPSLMQQPTSFTVQNSQGIYHFIDVRDWYYHPDANAAMEEELTAQFNRLKVIIGSQRIDSLSSHQNIHLFNEDYVRIVRRLSEDNWIPVRSPVRWEQDDRTKLYPDAAGLQPIQRAAIRTILACKDNTQVLLWNGISGTEMKKRRILINENRLKRGSPNSMSGHWYGQPKKKAIEWLVQQLTNKHLEIPPYATELLMHLSNSTAGDMVDQNYPMYKRLAEFNMLNSPSVKAFIQSLYSKPNFELGSYRKVLLGETISYDLLAVV